MSTSNPEDLKKLFAAVKNGDVAGIRALLTQGVDPNGRNAQDETPLMVAAPKGNLEIFDLLQKAGADLGARTKSGNLVLVRAAMCRHGNEAVALEMLQCIVNAVGIGPDQTDSTLPSSGAVPTEVRTTCGAGPVRGRSERPHGGRRVGVAESRVGESTGSRGRFSRPGRTRTQPSRVAAA